MKEKSKPTRREFMGGVLAAGAALTFAEWDKAASGEGGSGDSQGPLAATEMEQPDGVCAWVGFSPAGDQAAFVAGPPGAMSLFVSRAGRPNSFDVLWQPLFNVSIIKACAWSPNGKEIAFIVQAGDEKKNSRNARASILVAEVASRAVREPVIIVQTSEGVEKKLSDASYKKSLCWCNDACVCVPANKPTEVLKFDARTGKSETLISLPQGEAVSSLALTPGGELRYVKAGAPPGENGVQFQLCGLKQGGTTVDYGNLSQQSDRISSARLSPQGDFVFMEKREAASESKPFPRTTNLIYKIESRGVIGQIPAMVNAGRDMYYYAPMTVRNGNVLIAIEMASLTADGSQTERNHRSRAVKITL